MTSVSSVGKVAYIYDSSGSGTWYPIAGTTNTAANFNWTGTHAFSNASPVLFSSGLKAVTGVNNFENPAERESVIPSPTNGATCFVRKDASGNVINQLQYYYSGWRNINDSVDLSPVKTSNYTLAVADAGKTIIMNATTPSTLVVTIPTNASAALPIGATINIIQTGTAVTSVTPADSSVTLVSKTGRKLAAQYSAATLIKLDTNSWILIGDLVA